MQVFRASLKKTTGVWLDQMPDKTFIATWLAVSFCGAKLLKVDSKPDGFNTQQIFTNASE
jgi:hypothetical protein